MDYCTNAYPSSDMYHYYNNLSSPWNGRYPPYQNYYYYPHQGSSPYYSQSGFYSYNDYQEASWMHNTSYQYFQPHQTASSYYHHHHQPHQQQQHHHHQHPHPQQQQHQMYTSNSSRDGEQENKLSANLSTTTTSITPSETFSQNEDTSSYPMLQDTKPQPSSTNHDANDSSATGVQSFDDEDNNSSSTQFMVEDKVTPHSQSSSTHSSSPGSGIDPTQDQDFKPLPGFHQAFTKFGKMFNTFLNQHMEDMDIMEQHSNTMNNQMCLYNDKK